MKCKGKKKDGTLCNRNVLEGNDYCYNHRSDLKSEIITIKSFFSIKFLYTFMAVFLAVFLFLWIVAMLDISSYKLLEDLNITIRLYFSIFFVIILMFYLIKFFIIKSEIHFLNKYLSNISFWGVIAFSLVIVMLSLAFSLYNGFTSYPLPFEGYLNTYDKDSAIYLEQFLKGPALIKCYEEKGLRDYVVNKKIICKINIDYRKGYLDYLYKVEKIYFLKNNSQFERSSIMDKNQISNNTQLWIFDLEIDKEFDQALINFYFINSSGELHKTHNLFITPIRILSEEDYYKKREQSLALFMTMISVLIFSTVSSIKIFRELCKKDIN